MERSEFAYWTEWIDKMTQLDCARFKTWADPRHPVFVDPELHRYFDDHLRDKGGMTWEIENKALKLP